MLARGRGTIISVVSRSAVRDYAFTTAYSASKAVLLRFHHCLELEIRGRGVYTYAVQPGTIPTDLANSEGVVNEDTANLVPEFRRMLESSVGTATETARLAADTFVTLAADEEARILSGKYIDAQQDLGEVLKEARDGGDGRIEEEQLYVLKVVQLK